MKTKLLIVAGTALTVGMLTIALPVFAQNDASSSSGTAQATQQEGQAHRFRQNMMQRAERTPPTFDEQKSKMTENLTNAQTNTQKLLDELKSGELETKLNTRLQTISSYTEQINSATSEEDLKTVRENMRNQMETLRENGELPLGLGFGGPGRGMGGFGGKFGPPPSTDN